MSYDLILKPIATQFIKKGVDLSNETLMNYLIFDDELSVPQETRNYFSISDYFFLKKCKAFFNGVGSLGEKVSFLARYSEKSDFFEKIYMLINGINNEEKVILIGKFFKKFLYDFITLEEYLEVTQLIEFSFLNDLRHLQILFNRKEFDQMIIGSTDISIIRSTPLGIFNLKNVWGGTGYELNEFGRKVFEQNLF